ncbi:aromatic amino acid lyase, partial [bacterium]|nr:aromatic amino acid lyase [bacterium]
LAELGSLSERRIAKLIDPSYSGLPCFLVENEGLNSGFMIAHVTAAALVSENRLLTHPSSTDSIPTNNEKEDHVSMGPMAARKAKTILENVEMILAIEMLCAAQALNLREPLKPGIGAAWLLKQVRALVPRLKTDRVLTPDIEAITGIIRSGALHSGARKEGLL